jgi:hypothetical protein
MDEELPRLVSPIIPEEEGARIGSGRAVLEDVAGEAPREPVGEPKTDSKICLALDPNAVIPELPEEKLFTTELDAPLLPEVIPEESSDSVTPAPALY